MDNEELTDLLDSNRRLGLMLAQKYRLRLRQPRISGTGGNWLGVGIGSSVDFQDHRPYAVGDDPRYINWQAYARLGEYTMKLYRDEVSPTVDVVIDVSASMFASGAKLGPALALFYFCVENARELGATLRCYSVREESLTRLTPEAVHSGSWLSCPEGKARGLVPNFDRVPWRAHSARIVVSDLLFPGMPNDVLRSFHKDASWNAVLSVYSNSESDPSWNGGMQLVDSETEAERILYCDRSFLNAYQANYRKHFSIWSAYARRMGVAFLRVKAEEAMEEQLLKDGVSSGVLSG